MELILLVPLTFAAAYIRGAQEHGLMTTAKYFPGNAEAADHDKSALAANHISSGELQQTLLRI